METTLTEIELPEGVSGRLFRSPMPGTEDWPLDEGVKEITQHKVEVVVCLAPMYEVKRYAPRYARHIQEEDLPWETWNDLVIPDGGLPDDEEEFFDLALEVAEELRSGTCVLIHCYAGEGRTGMLATCVLMALGLSLEQAETAVRRAGAGAETPQQRQLLARAAVVLTHDNE